MTPIPDLGLIRGETVTVRTPSTGYDDHMEEVVTWGEETVGNVVVTPGTTSDVRDGTRPDGTRVEFTLGFPKIFTASLRGCRVLVRGIECAVIGDPQPYAPDNTPGAHDRTVEVARVDG